VRKWMIAEVNFKKSSIKKTEVQVSDTTMLNEVIPLVPKKYA
jgi:hypothetical protein